MFPKQIIRQPDLKNVVIDLLKYQLMQPAAVIDATRQ
jgi:hypothetical protein